MQVLGLLSIRWNGETLPIEAGASLKLGGLAQDPIVYGRQVGRAQKFEASEITATMPLARGRSMTALLAVQEAELQVTCDTGQSYVFPDAFLTQRPTITAGEGGKIELMWSGGDFQEILNG
jgi:hypothetical protein